MTENTKDGKHAGADGNQSDGSLEEKKQSDVRQDMAVVFQNEKDLRHHEAIRIKASHYTGIALRVKVLSPGAIENVLYAIDLDSGIAEKKQANADEDKADKKGKKEKKEEQPPPAESAVIPT